MKLSRYAGVTVSWLALSLSLGGQEKNLMQSLHAEQDRALETNPDLDFWQTPHPVFAQVDPQGHALAQFRTEIRSRWTKDDLYFLFICPYHQLYLKPSPDTIRETNQLWKWNVAEVFIGSDFDDIRRYKEFELSPHDEWIDLDINLNKPHHEQGWVWNSGFGHAARIDSREHVWYAALRIPFAALGISPPGPGTTFRLNLFRTEGPPREQKEIMWQPTMSTTFHVPERFGLLRLAEH